MRKRQHTPEQAIRNLDEGHRRPAEGMAIEEVCKHLEITSSTWFRCRNQFGGIKADDAKTLRTSPPIKDTELLFSLSPIDFRDVTSLNAMVNPLPVDRHTSRMDCRPSVMDSGVVP